MKILELSILSLIIAQLFKVFTTFPPDITRIIGSGGMPSSHSAFVSALSTSIGIKYGFSSDLFAIVAVFSLITLYDSGGVRRSVGEQARILNHMIMHFELKKLDRDKEVIKKDLKELIGHTPFEVWVGTLLGVIIAIIGQNFKI